MIHDQGLVDRLSGLATELFDDAVYRATRVSADPTAPSINGARDSARVTVLVVQPAEVRDRVDEAVAVVGEVRCRERLGGIMKSYLRARVFGQDGVTGARQFPFAGTSAVGYSSKWERGPRRC